MVNKSFFIGKYREFALLNKIFCIQITIFA